MRTLAASWTTAVLLVAGIAKLTDRVTMAKLADDLVRLGSPRAVSVPVAWAVGAMEIVVCALVLAPISRTVGLVAATGCFLLFSLATARLSDAREGGCHCFGRVARYDSPRVNLATNLLLSVCCALGAANYAAVRSPGGTLLTVSVGLLAAGATFVGPTVAAALVDPMAPRR